MKRNQVKEIIKTIYRISTKIRYNYYLEEVYKYIDILSKKDKLDLLKSEFANLTDFEILKWFEKTDCNSLTSLGLSRLLKVLLNDKNILCEIVKCREDNKRETYYINKVKINGFWYNIDLSKNLDYFLYKIYPEILYTNNDTKYLIFENEELKKFNSNEAVTNYNIEKEYMECLQNKRISRKTIKKLKEVEIGIEKRFFSNSFKKYCKENKKLKYEEFLKLTDKEINKMRNRSIEIELSLYSEYSNLDLMNSKKLIRNIYKIDKIWINTKSILNLKTDKKIVEFIKILRAKNVFIGIYDEKADQIFRRFEDLEESLTILFDWKKDILKELNKIDKLKFLKLNPELEKDEVEDFLKFKFAYIKMHNNFIRDIYFNKLMLYFETQLCKNDIRYALKTQNLEAISLKRGVCASFSIILEYLLELLNIESSSILGTINLEEGHTWLKVKIGRNYYNVDFMWDFDTISEYKKSPKFLFKSDKDFKEHIPFNKNLKPAIKSLNSKFVNRNFNYNEIVRYRSKKEEEQMKKVKSDVEKLIFYDRLETLFYSKYQGVEFFEFIKNIEQKKYVNNQIYYKYLILNVEEVYVNEFIKNYKLVLKYINHIQFIRIHLSKLSNYNKKLANILNKLMKRKFEKFDFIRIDIDDSPEKKFLEDYEKLN